MKIYIAKKITDEIEGRFEQFIGAFLTKKEAEKALMISWNYHKEADSEWEEEWYYNKKRMYAYHITGDYGYQYLVEEYEIGTIPDYLTE